MNNVKTVFSIKDLENLTGVKAHTIRIWERRYHILEPTRTQTNIRLYDISSLQKLLNITLLHKHGYKISKISKLPKERIPELVNEIISDKSVKHHAISAFKLAMMNFDQTLFFNTYNKLLSEMSFREVFYKILIPLIDEVGILWQTDTITPAHEHFISYLIKQKLLSNTEKIQHQTPTRHDRIFVLYLPLNEIHELGLMFVNYEIISHGYKSVFLGESVPMEYLKDLKNHFDNITYICYMTVEPGSSEINNYIQKMKKNILDYTTQLWMIGKATQFIEPLILVENTITFTSIQELVNSL